MNALSHQYTLDTKSVFSFVANYQTYWMHLTLYDKRKGFVREKRNTFIQFLFFLLLLQVLKIVYTKGRMKCLSEIFLTC